MSDQIAERDWKYMREIKLDLLNILTARINQESVAILSEENASAHERYQRIYRHIRNSDKVVAECFDDWRRSSLAIRLVSLRRHGLLSDEHMDKLSEHTRDTIRKLVDMAD